jgi:hypothetical protein
MSRLTIRDHKTSMGYARLYGLRKSGNLPSVVEPDLACSQTGRDVSHNVSVMPDDVRALRRSCPGGKVSSGFSRPIKRVVSLARYGLRKLGMRLPTHLSGSETLSKIATRVWTEEIACSGFLRLCDAFCVVESRMNGCRCSTDKVGSQSLARALTYSQPPTFGGTWPDFGSRGELGGALPPGFVLRRNAFRQGNAFCILSDSFWRGRRRRKGRGVGDGKLGEVGKPFGRPPVPPTNIRPVVSGTSYTPTPEISSVRARGG